ncbi:Cro/CI family transcriptional regulator [Microbulbifer thermotolerans]|uniref:Cro/CI family transcriptional regulator n=1 Tax=Microbulbifer thermotolerans TaxID=252514 RepID=UPI003969F952
MDIKTKTQAKKLFGSSAAIARALEITSSAVSQWPERLPRATQDRLVGAAYRLGLLSVDKKQRAKPQRRRYA